MVNLSSLEKIVRFAEENNLTKMKPWHLRAFPVDVERTNVYQMNLRKKIRFLLDMLSGGDIVRMLQCVLRKKERLEVSPDRHEAQALKKIAECYKRTNLKKRYHLAGALKRSGMTYPTARKLGFTVSQQLWKSCNNQQPRNKGGGQPISEELRNSIRTYLDSKSNIGANKLVKNKDKNDETFNEFVPVRYLTSNVNELYNEFPLAEKVSKTTFRKYLKCSNEFKKPCKWTDLCDYCEQAKNIKVDLVRILESYKCEWPELSSSSLSTGLKQMLQFFQEKRDECRKLYEEAIQHDNLTEEQACFDRLKELNTAIENVHSYEAIEFHKNVAECQRLAYNEHHKNVEALRGKIMIDVDFKQKIVIGMGGQRQVNSQYYEQVERSCLGFGVFYVDKDVDGIEKIKLINFNVISSDIRNDSVAAVRGFRLLRQQEFFKAFQFVTDYIVWMDCGPHFRNGSVIGYLLNELASEKIHVNVNFFGDKHGKNSRDAHFSQVTRFVEAKSLSQRLTSSQDIVDAIHEGQARANRSSDRQVITFAIAFDHARDLSPCLEINQIQPDRVLSIKNIGSFYNYRTVGDDFRLMTSVLSNQENLIEMKQNGDRAYQVVDEVVIKKEEISSSSLSKMCLKQARINCAMQKIKSINCQTSYDETEPIEFIDFELTTFDDIQNIVEQITAPEPAQTKPAAPQLAIVDKVEQAQSTPIQHQPTVQQNMNFVKIKTDYDYCRYTRIRNKPLCSECTSPCKYSLEMINKHLITQAQIMEELRSHNHPSSRKIPVGNNETRFQKKSEAVRELAQHYINAHKMSLIDMPQQSS